MLAPDPGPVDRSDKGFPQRHRIRARCQTAFEAWGSLDHRTPARTRARGVRTAGLVSSAPSRMRTPCPAIAASEHVRAAFGIKRAMLAQIAAGTITTTAEIDAAFSV